MDLRQSDIALRPTPVLDSVVTNDVLAPPTRPTQTPSTTTTAAPLVAINQTAVSEGLQKLADNVVNTASSVVQAPFKYINAPSAGQTSDNEIAVTNTGERS